MHDAKTDEMRTAATGIKALFVDVTCFYLPPPSEKVQTANQEGRRDPISVKGIHELMCNMRYSIYKQSCTVLPTVCVAHDYD